MTHDPNKDIWHPGEKKYIKQNGRLTEFGLAFFDKYEKDSQHGKQKEIQKDNEGRNENGGEEPKSCES